MCAVGHQLHQSDQVEVQVDETHQQVAAAAEMNIPYFMFKTQIALVFVKFDIGYVWNKITVGIAILVGWAGRWREEKC